MDNQIKMMLEAEIASIGAKMKPMYEELTKLAGKSTERFWLLDAEYRQLKGKLEGIDFVLKALGYTGMSDASGKFVIVDTKTCLHAIGWDQFEGGAEG